jgi:hypothetical protein
MIFERLRSLVAKWRAEEIDEQMGKLLPVESSPLLFTRRRFLQTVVPAALVMPVLAEELLHPGRAIFLPSSEIILDEGINSVPFFGAEATNVWRVNSLGGYLYSSQLANILRESVLPLSKFRQFADVQPTPRERFQWDVYPSDATARM